MNQGLIPHADPVGGDAIAELIRNAWTARVSVLAIVALFTAVGGIVGSLAEKQYRAEILVSPVSENPTGGAGGMGALASQYGELASMAGLSLSGRGGNNKEESLAVLQSQLITEAYIRDNDLLPVLYYQLWDGKAMRWKTADVSKIPSLWKANQAFKKIRDVKQDKQSGLTTLRITWRDPVVAAQWANELVKRTNAYLRDKAISESEQNIAYLNQEAARTNIIEAKAAIYSILKEEVNKQMIAKGREEYALKVIDPAQAPEKSSTPSPLLVALFGFALGTVVAALVVLRKTFMQRF